MGTAIPRALALRTPKHDSKQTQLLDDRLLTVNEVRAMLRVSRHLMYDLIRSNRLKTLKIGRRRLVPRHAIEQFIAEQLDEGAI